MARKHPPQTAAALLAGDPLRLGALLQERIDAFAKKPMKEENWERDARTIGGFARSGTLVLGMEAALRRAEVQGAKAARLIDTLSFDDDDNRDEGDEVEMNERPGADEPQDLGEVLEFVSQRFGRLGASLDKAGILEEFVRAGRESPAEDLAVLERRETEPA